MLGLRPLHLAQCPGHKIVLPNPGKVVTPQLTKLRKGPHRQARLQANLARQVLTETPKPGNSRLRSVDNGKQPPLQWGQTFSHMLIGCLYSIPS